MDAVLDNLDVFVEGFTATVTLTLLAAVGALVLGTLIAAMRVSPVPPLRWAGAAYVQLVRNTPLTVVFFLVVFGLPEVDVLLPFFRFAVIALTLYTAAFVAEAVRSGIGSVAAGQAEASRSIGMTFGQTLRLVVLPQAFANIVPPLASVFIALLKNTSIAYAFGVFEGTQAMNRLINQFGSSVIWIIGTAALIYVVLALLSAAAFSALERKVAVSRCSSVLYDVQGPKARRRVLIGSLIGLALLALLVVLAAQRLAANGQFEARLYEPFFNEPLLWKRIGEGLLNTLKAAGIALVLALVLGVVLAFGRLSSRAWLRVPAVVVVEFFRATPLLLLILFFFLAFPLAFQIQLEPLEALVLGLMLYNGSVIAEIIRAGILALPGGQTEAAMAVGLRRGQVLRLVLLPQAVRIMLPSLISQLVVLLKDTSLGFVVNFEEVLRTGNQLVQVLDNPIQLYVLIALIFIIINMSLSALATWVEGRQRRTIGTSAAPVGITGMEQGGAPHT